MTKPVFQNLINQQIAVLRTISFIIVVFMPLLLLVLYSAFGIKQTLPAVILPYVIGVLLNILLLSLHKNAVITYLVLITITFIELHALILVTGGLASPITLIVISLPGFAFYTSRKQGKIWFGICFASVIFLYTVRFFGITVTNIVSEPFRMTFLFIILLFVLILTSVYLLLVKQDVSNAHKAFSYARKEIEEKSIRMENLLMLVNYSTELMCVIDLQTLVFDEVNPMFKILLGFELSELRGEPVNRVFEEASISKFSAVKDDQVLNFNSPAHCKNSADKTFSWTATTQKGKLFAYAREISK